MQTVRLVALWWHCVGTVHGIGRRLSGTRWVVDWFGRNGWQCLALAFACRALVQEAARLHTAW
jgi:hypothetical protein